ncbi:hypothetical protein V8G54_009111 [Vigna mungo]|uniref:Uncharacterized protein n=1 Tax=Vigna mungo TaxID=3915 RepID=A0AAQ3S558_VIGMU
MGGLYKAIWFSLGSRRGGSVSRSAAAPYGIHDKPATFHVATVVSLSSKGAPNPLLILSRFPINNRIRVFKKYSPFSFVCASLIPFRSNPRLIPISIFSLKIAIFFISCEFWVLIGFCCFDIIVGFGFQITFFLEFDIMVDFGLIKENFVIVPDQQVVFKLTEMITDDSPMTRTKLHV